LTILQRTENRLVRKYLRIVLDIVTLCNYTRDMTTKQHRISPSFSAEMKARIEKLAEMKDRTPSWIVREATKAYLAQEEVYFRQHHAVRDAPRRARDQDVADVENMPL